MLALKTKKATQKISMYVLIRRFLLKELKISHSKEFPNFAFIIIDLNKFRKKNQQHPNKNLRPNLDINTLSVISLLNLIFRM